MRITFLLFMICLSGKGFAQETIEVTYQRTNSASGYSLMTVPEKVGIDGLNWHTIISGETTFNFQTSGKISKNKYIKDGVYASKPIHHSTYYESKHHQTFSTVAFKGKYYIRSEEIPNSKNYWMDTTKNILDYECQAAMIYNSRGDSSTMWIARNVQPGLVTYHNGYVVPGIAMESLNLNYGINYKAVKIEKTNNTINFLKDYPQRAAKEYKAGEKDNNPIIQWR